MFALKTTILTVLIWFASPDVSHLNKNAETVLIHEINYVDGVYYHNDRIFNGDIVDYYENDKLKFRYGVLNGRLNGKAIEFYPSGKVKSVRHYTISKLFGQFTEYYETGEVRAAFKVKLNAYHQGEIVEDITLGTLKKGKLKTKQFDKGIIYFIGKEGETFSTSELISILNQTKYKITNPDKDKVLIEVN